MDSAGPEEALLPPGIHDWPSGRRGVTSKVCTSNCLYPYEIFGPIHLVAGVILYLHDSMMRLSAE